MQPTLPWPSHDPGHWAVSVQRNGSFFLSTRVSCVSPTSWAHGTISVQRGPFSNDTQGPQRPAKAPQMSTPWDGEERQASKVARTLSGALAFSGPGWPHTLLSTLTGLWGPCAALQRSSWRNEKEVLSRAQSRLNQKEKETQRRAWTWTRTTASVHGLGSLLLLPLPRKALQIDNHPSGRTLCPEPPSPPAKRPPEPPGTPCPIAPFLCPSSQPWAGTNQGAGGPGDA